jgi:hypothetical protein
VGWPVGACLLAISAALGLSGCYSPMYPQPYGPYGQPVYQGTVPPGGMYAPGMAPGTSLSTPTYNSTTPTPDSGGDAPFYPNSSTQQRPVPEYNDAGSQYYPPAGSTTGATEGFNSTTEPAGEDFLTPTTGGVVKETSLSREARDFADEQYAYDTTGHRWLQGVVSYDPRDKSWGIVYSDDPAASDPHAGYLTLVKDPKLAVLKDGDVVRLDGEVDPGRVDFSGRPSYAVRQITHISR